MKNFKMHFLPLLMPMEWNHIYTYAKKGLWAWSKEKWTE